MNGMFFIVIMLKDYRIWRIAKLNAKQLQNLYFCIMLYHNEKCVIGCLSAYFQRKMLRFSVFWKNQRKFSINSEKTPLKCVIVICWSAWFVVVVEVS